MDDLISRRAAIDEVQRHRENVLGGYEYDEGVAFVYAAAHNHIIEVIKCIPSAHQWIPCSEMLPMDKGVYLVTDDSGRVAWVEKSWFMWCDDGSPFWEYANVTAWMPLPEPYKGDEK